MTPPTADDHAPPLTFRAGRVSDQAAIAEMTKAVWEGQDYLPTVWQEWVADPRGLLRVGMVAGKIVAVGRAVELTPGNWWLEGLRVHPAQQGRGYATRMHEQMVALALQQDGLRTLGLATSWKNEAVAYLARRSGMTLRGDYRLFKGVALAEPVTAVAAYPNATVPDLMARLRESRWLALTGGYAMRGWVAHPLNETWLEEVIQAGGVWGCGDALALVGGRAKKEQLWLYLLVGGREAEQRALVRHARHLAHRRHPNGHLRAFVPVGDADSEALTRPFLNAGMGDPWDGDSGAFHLYHFALTVEHEA